MAVEIRPLQEEDDRSLFRSGDADLDRFFHRYAGQNQFRHHIGTTYVAVEGGRIQGYATVSPGAIEIDDLPPALGRRLPAYPLPILRLARLAADERARGGGIGRALLQFVLRLAIEMSRTVGCFGVVVDAKADAAGYYERFGFIPLECVEGELLSRPREIPLFLPIAEIERAAGG